MTLLDAVVRSLCADPHALLGPHIEAGHLVVRAFFPGATEAQLRFAGGEAQTMTPLHAAGVFCWRSPKPTTALPEPAEYRFLCGGVGFYDCYGFAPTLGSIDLHLLGEGRHRQLYRVLGGRLREHQGVRGASFAVWAPSAQRVSVVGDFNDWDGRRHAMRRLGQGFWELFVPSVSAGASYKFEIVGAAGEVVRKSDPLALASEIRPKTASRLVQSRYCFEDAVWLSQREQKQSPASPMAIYEVHLGSWRHAWEERASEHPSWLTYRELAEQLVPYVAELGFTHIELLPVMEHPYDGSWGYQVTGFFSPTSRYGSPDDFRYLVDCCHRAGIGVLLDWVPAHFPKDAFSLGRFDGTALYEHLDPRRGEHKQWGTYIFNYARHEVRNFLVANALYWLDEFHIDGLRVDAVASMLYLDYGSEHEGDWLPNEQGGRENHAAVEFLRELTHAVHERFPGCLLIAEESTAWPGVTSDPHGGGLGFDLKWNMGWMHDTLEYFSTDPLFRKHHHRSLTFGILYAFSENYLLPLSHDEVVHLKKSLLLKMAGDDWQRFANLRALFAHMWAHPGKKLLFMGGELGQLSEWNEQQQLDWDLLSNEANGGLQRLVSDLNHLYRDLPQLFELDNDESGFRWIQADDAEQSVIAYLRVSRSGQYLLCVVNLTPVVREEYRLGVPTAAHYREVLNSDAAVYGGSDVGNCGGRSSEPVPCHGCAHSLRLRLPPLGALWLVPDGKLC